MIQASGCDYSKVEQGQELEGEDNTQHLDPQEIAADEQIQNLRRNGVRSDIVTSAYKRERRDSFIVA